MNFIMNILLSHSFGLFTYHFTVLHITFLAK